MQLNAGVVARDYAVLCHGCVPPRCREFQVYAREMAPRWMTLDKQLGALVERGSSGSADCLRRGSGGGGVLATALHLSLPLLRSHRGPSRRAPVAGLQ